MIFLHQKDILHPLHSQHGIQLGSKRTWSRTSFQAVSDGGCHFSESELFLSACLPCFGMKLWSIDPISTTPFHLVRSKLFCLDQTLWRVVNNYSWDPSETRLFPKDISWGLGGDSSHMSVTCRGFSSTSGPSGCCSVTWWKNKISTHPGFTLAAREALRISDLTRILGSGLSHFKDSRKEVDGS